MHIEFLPPAPALKRHVSVYYQIKVDEPMVEDIERADVGYLRFFLSGRGTIRYASGTVDEAHAVTLFGPATETGVYRLKGPLNCFGCVLLPEFWGGIVDADASNFANRCLDGRPALGADAQAHSDRLVEMDSFSDMVQATDAWLIRKIKQIPADQIAVIDRIGDWLSGFPIASTEKLYTAIADKSERQVARLANRHFGAPPKMLARKYRALRTASRIIGTRGEIPASLISEYSDRAHLTREVRHFTGVTPKQLQINANPIVRATLHPDNFRAEAPWT